MLFRSRLCAAAALDHPWMLRFSRTDKNHKYTISTNLRTRFNKNFNEDLGIYLDFDEDLDNHEYLQNSLQQPNVTAPFFYFFIFILKSVLAWSLGLWRDVNAPATSTAADPPKKYKCSYCPKKFKDFSRLR